jgi:MOSC domain-containing protein YiiM
MRVLHLYISPGHNFFGHHGKPPGKHEIVEVSELNCLADRGIEGDRFCDYKRNYKGQISFFAFETFEEICAGLRVQDRSPKVFRRNVITQGVDLKSLIGKPFEVQGVQFLGTEECAPCFWMDQAFGPGAELFLKGKGGLRARIISGGKVVSENKKPLVIGHDNQGVR